MAHENKIRGISIGEVEKPFQCTECDLQFTTNAAKKIHLKSHKKRETYVCKECNFKTNKFLILRKHRLDECGVKKHICNKCGNSFPTTEEFKVHMRQFHNSGLTGERHCKDCEFKTYSIAGMTKHRNAKHREYACAECDFTCGCKNQMKKHIVENHIPEIDDSIPLEDPSNDFFTCPLCEYLDLDASNMEKHIQEFHEVDKPFPCAECDQDFYDDVELELHIMAEHEEVNCSLCDYKGSINNFAIHMKSHSKVVKTTDDHACTLCDFTCTSDDELEDHIYEFHTKGVEHLKIGSDFDLEKQDKLSKRGRKIIPKKWFDDYDNTKDNNEAELKNQNDINKDQLFTRQGIDCKCLICGEYFVNKAGLNIHMTRKHGNYECEECNTVFKTADGLKNHIENVHSSTNNFSCAKCDYTCNTETDLIKHTSVHKSNRVFTCPEREDSFSEEADLINHISSMAHTGVKSTQCKADIQTEECSNIHKETHDSDVLAERKSIQDHGCSFVEKNISGTEIEGDQDYSGHLRNVTDPMSPDDSLCMDINEKVVDTNIDDCTEHEVVMNPVPVIGEISKSNKKLNNILEESKNDFDVINEPQPIIGEISKSKKKENNIQEKSKKDFDFEKLFLNDCENKGQHEDEVVGKVNVECHNENKNTKTEVNVGQSNDYAEEDDDEDDLGVDGDYIGDMYEDEERVEDENIQNQATDITWSILNKENIKDKEFDNVRKTVKAIEDKTKEINTDNTDDVKDLKIDKKVEELEPFCTLNKKSCNLNDKSDVLRFGFDSDDESELQEVSERDMNMARPSRYIDESFSEKPEKRKADNYLQRPAIKRVAEIKDDKEKNIIQDEDVDESYYEKPEKRKADSYLQILDIKKEAELNDDKEKNITDEEMKMLYGCSECDYVGIKEEFHVHMRKHGENQHFFCKICEYICNSKKDLNEHITTHQTPVTLYACPQCDFTTVTVTGLRIHMSYHTRREFLCEHCSLQFIDIATLKEHHKKNHKGPIKLIKIAKENIKKRNRTLNPKYASDQLYSPIKEPHMKLDDNKLGKSFIMSNNLSKRKIVAIPYKAGQPKFSIPLDNNPSANEQNLETDVSAISNTELHESVSKLDRVQEENIKKEFFAIPNVQNTMESEYPHESEASGSKTNEQSRYQCEHCMFCSINHRGLSVHMIRMHGVRNPSPQFPSPKDTWVDSKQYACELCDFRASSNEKIGQHYRIHTGNRPWKCMECGATFTTKKARMIHAACHLEEKQFKCKYDGCNYATTLKINLNSHYYAHTLKEKKIRLKLEGL